MSWYPGGYSVMIYASIGDRFCSIAAPRESALEQNIFLLSMLSIEMIFS